MLRLRISKFHRMFASVGVLALFICTPVIADPHGHGHGPGHEHGRGPGPGGGPGHDPKIEVRDNGRDYEYKYQDGLCKYEYRLNYRSGEEKIKQKGDCRGVSPRRAIYPVGGPIVRDDGHYEEAPPSAPRRVACNREMIGTVLGGVLGGVAGSQVGQGDGRKVATVAGAIIGAVIGNNVGRRMDRADNGCAYQALEFASPGDTVYWRNPDSQVEYGITPAALTRRPDGRQCREYKSSAIGGGEAAKDLSGLACRRPDGSWEIE
jgi:surface antigen